MTSYVRDEEFDLRAILSVFRRRRNVVIGTVLLFTAAALAISKSLTPQYTASSTLVVEPRQVRLINFDDVNQEQGIQSDTEIINTHIEVITSQSFVHQVIEQLAIHELPVRAGWRL